MRHWPEWLFITLVMVLPVAVTFVRFPRTFIGFLIWLGLGMLVGGALWVTVIWLAVRGDESSYNARAEPLKPTEPEATPARPPE
jgi:hypothetical protein